MVGTSCDNEQQYRLLEVDGRPSRQCVVPWMLDKVFDVGGWWKAELSSSSVGSRRLTRRHSSVGVSAFRYSAVGLNTVPRTGV